MNRREEGKKYRFNHEIETKRHLFQLKNAEINRKTFKPIFQTHN